MYLGQHSLHGPDVSRVSGRLGDHGGMGRLSFANHRRRETIDAGNPVAKSRREEKIHATVARNEPRKQTSMSTTKDRMKEALPDVVMPACPIERVLKGQKALVTGGFSYVLCRYRSPPLQIELIDCR